MRIRAPKDFWSGLMFCGFAAVGILAARGYSLGAAGRMGPGYFPLLLGLVLAALGVILIARSVVLIVGSRGNFCSGVALARDLVSIPAECLGVAKVAVDMCADVDRLTQRQVERVCNAPLYGSPEFLRRTARFIED